MKTALEFRCRSAFGGEILARQATFLPVEQVPPSAIPEMFLPEMQYLAGIPPVFNFNRKI